MYHCKETLREEQVDASTSSLSPEVTDKVMSINEEAIDQAEQQSDVVGCINSANSKTSRKRAKLKQKTKASFCRMGVSFVLASINSDRSKNGTISRMDNNNSNKSKDESCECDHPIECPLLENVLSHIDIENQSESAVDGNKDNSCTEASNNVLFDLGDFQGELNAFKDKLN
jgi:hypothetical protein